MNKNKVVHFEIPVDDLDRAKKFYQEIFDWKMNDQSDMDYTLISTVEVDDKMMPKEPGGINGGMAIRGDMLKAPSISIAVDNIDNQIAAVKKAGGTIIMGKSPVGSMGFMAYFKDTEGNVLSLFEPLPWK